MAVALGNTVESEHQPGLAQLSKHLTGSVGLLCTSRSPEAVQDHFASFTPADYARAGTTATQTFVVPAGVVHATAGVVPPEEDEPVPHSLEPELRRCGMPTRLVKGKVMLDADYEVCREGQVLDSRQTTLLKRFGVEMAEFRVRLIA
jgi:mRNA turnover protein 4